MQYSKIGYLWLMLFIPLLCPAEDDFLEEYRRAELSKYKGLENSEYYKSMKEIAEGKAPEKSVKQKTTERKIATRSAFKEGSIDELRTLAEQGDTQAMINLGIYYEDKGDPALAHAWLRHAEDQGDKHSRNASRWREVVEGKRKFRPGRRSVNREESGYVWEKRMTPEEEANADMYYHIISKENSTQDENIDSTKKTESLSSTYIPPEQTSKSINKPDITTTQTSDDKYKSETDCSNRTGSCRLRHSEQGSFSYTPQK